LKKDKLELVQLKPTLEKKITVKSKGAAYKPSFNSEVSNVNFGSSGKAV